jgi:hypothetical protein
MTETRHTRDDQPILGAVDLQGDDPELAIYRCTPSGMARAGLPVDDPIPLFLAGPPRDAEQSDSGKAWKESALSPRVLRAAILAATAATVGFAIIPAKNPLAVLANAEASLTSASGVRAGVAPVKSPAVSAASSATADPPAPTRDEIAGALRAALQSQTEIRSPPADALPARRIDTDELAALLKRARSLIATGDITAARLLLERAAGAEVPGAALLLAQTYDPAVLGTPDTRSITPDSAAARSWYQKAAQFGSLEAQQRLKQMKD